MKCVLQERDAPHPSYRSHISGHVRVTINGVTHYLGKFISRESREKYDALISEYLSTGRSSRFEFDEVISPMTMAQLMALYADHCQTYYGLGQKSEWHRIRSAFATSLRRPRISTPLPAVEFAPRHVKAVWQVWIKAGDKSRDYINQAFKRLVRMFSWAVSEELLPAAVHEAGKAIQAAGVALGPAIRLAKE